MRLLCLVCAFLLCDMSSSISVALSNLFQMPPSSEWFSLFSHPAGLSVVANGYLDTINTLSGDRSFQPFQWDDPLFFSVALPIHSNQILLYLDSPMITSLLQLTFTTPPIILSQQNFSSSQSCQPIASNTLGVWMANYRYSIPTSVVYATISNGPVFNFTTISDNVFEGTPWDSFRTCYIHENTPRTAIFSEKMGRIYSVVSGNESLGLAAFDVSPSSFKMSSIPPFLFDNGVDYCCPYIHLALVQQETRLLVIYPYWTQPPTSPYVCYEGSTNKAFIGVVLLDARTFQVISKLTIDTQWYMNMGAITLGADVVVVWSLPLDLVRYTDFTVLQVVGDSIQVGNGFQIAGSQKESFVFLADVDTTSPKDSFFVALQSAPDGYNSTILQIKVTP